MTEENANKDIKMLSIMSKLLPMERKALRWFFENPVICDLLVLLSIAPWQTTPKLSD